MLSNKKNLAATLLIALIIVLHHIFYCTEKPPYGVYSKYMYVCLCVPMRCTLMVRISQKHDLRAVVQIRYAVMSIFLSTVMTSPSSTTPMISSSQLPTSGMLYNSYTGTMWSL